jgi:hypothetical protein
MKKLMLVAVVAILSFGCNDKSGSSASGGDSTKMSDNKTAELVYPYTLEKGYRDWQPGDQKHAVTVMKALKAFENGNIPECVAEFGDSVELFFDNYHDKLSNDSLRKYFVNSRASNKTMKITMQDWESVIAKDKKDEWVTLWYKEAWVDQTGKADSLAVIDDAKMVNGKIVLLDEKIQHYPPAKK